MFAYVTSGTVQATGRLPAAARRVDTGQWVLGLAAAPVELQQACGWYQVTDTQRPADADTTTHDRTVELVDGTPTVIWTERPKTQAELDADADFAKQQAEQDALPVAARLAVVGRVTADELSESEVASVAPLFPAWQPGLTVEVGDVYSYDGTLVECLQAHTNHDPTHTPDTTPALWKVHRTNPGTDYPVWVQPDSTNPYNATWDDGTSPVVVRYPDARGDLYVNTHGDGNIWSPADYGWALYAP